MQGYDLNGTELETDFRRRGIDTSAPGFYDDPAFLAAERADNTFLNRYARYVDVRAYDDDYIERARVEIPLITDALHAILVEDGRKGACVDMSGILSRVLDREGFWNYVVKGSLTLTFPEGSGLGTRYFWSVDVGEFVAGHAWVVAPPFVVLDITLRQQPYDGKQRDYLPDRVIASEAGTRSARVDDIYSPEVRMLIGINPIGRVPTLRIVDRAISDFTHVFPPRVLTEGETTLTYVPVAIGMTEEALEALEVPFGGRRPLALYEEDVLPRLAAVRAGPSGL